VEECTGAGPAPGFCLRVPATSPQRRSPQGAAGWGMDIDIPAVGDEVGLRRLARQARAGDLP